MSAKVMGSYAVFLAAWAVMGHTLGLDALFQLGFAAGAAQALWRWRLIRGRSRQGCFTDFRLNHWVGLAVFVGVAADMAWR